MYSNLRVVEVTGPAVAISFVMLLLLVAAASCVSKDSPRGNVTHCMKGSDKFPFSYIGS